MAICRVLLPDDQTGELPVTEESVRSIVDAMGILFYACRTRRS